MMMKMNPPKEVMIANPLAIKSTRKEKEVGMRFATILQNIMMMMAVVEMTLD